MSSLAQDKGENCNADGGEKEVERENNAETDVINTPDKLARLASAAAGQKTMTVNTNLQEGKTGIASLDMGWGSTDEAALTESLLSSTQVSNVELTRVALSLDSASSQSSWKPPSLADGSSSDEENPKKKAKYITPTPKTVGVGKKKKKSKKKKKIKKKQQKKAAKAQTSAHTTLAGQRKEFLDGRYEVSLKDGEMVGNQSVRDSAMHMNLGVLRSSKSRITFYPRGLPKAKNSICTFSRTTLDPHHWSFTGDADQVLAFWEKCCGAEAAVNRPATHTGEFLPRVVLYFAIAYFLRHVHPVLDPPFTPCWPQYQGHQAHASPGWWT